MVRAVAGLFSFREAALTRKPMTLFANLNERGEEAEPDVPVPLDVWCYVIDLETRKQTHMVRRDRWRTYREVFKDLEKHVDIVLCSKRCGFSEPRSEYHVGDYDWVDAPCPQCLENDRGTDSGFLEALVDEYLSDSAPYDAPGKDTPVPAIENPFAFPVVGGSEGHYIHIGGLTPDSKFHYLAIAKTFQGWTRAAEIADRAGRALWGEL